MPLTLSLPARYLESSAEMFFSLMHELQACHLQGDSNPKPNPNPAGPS